jgi:hypothetical protein
MVAEWEVEIMEQQPASVPAIAPAAARDEAVYAGQAVYTPTLLSFYDWFVLGFSNRFAWQCPSGYLLSLYNRFVSANHLDVGVGTGYFLDRCRFPSASPTITLVDLNANSLEATAGRLARYRPRTQRANVLEPIDLGGARFDSIGLNFLLHCLPGSFATKSIVFQNLRPLLNEGGVMFGSTILGRGVPRNVLARSLMAFYNKRGIFSNLQDDADGLERALAGQFRQHRLRIQGCVALFAARD